MYNGKIQNISFKLIEKNDLVVQSLQKGDWEKDSLEKWIDECSKVKDGLILDIGSYNGIYAILAAKIKSGIIAFEPLKRNYSKVVVNLKLNNLSNVKALSIALGNSNETKSIYTTNKIKNPSASTLNKSFINERYKDVEKVSVKTLDNIINEKVALIKIDVERFEKQVLEGSTNVLKKYKPGILIELLDDDQKNEVIKFLKQFNYNTIKAIDDRNYFLS